MTHDEESSWYAEADAVGSSSGNAAVHRKARETLAAPYYHRRPPNRRSRSPSPPPPDAPPAASAPQPPADNDLQGDRQLESESVFAGDWGEPEPALDGWCFMCARRAPQAQRMSNPYYTALIKMFAPGGNQTILSQCQDIKRYYDENFRRAQGDRAWTLRSVKKHMFQHAAASKDMMLSEMARIYFAQVQLYCETGLRVRDPQTNQVFVNQRGQASFDKMTRLFLTVLAQQAKYIQSPLFEMRRETNAEVTRELRRGVTRQTRVSGFTSLTKCRTKVLAVEYIRDLASGCI
jgi:hypothetical protein